MNTSIFFNNSAIMTLANMFMSVLGMDKNTAVRRAWSIAKQQKCSYAKTGEVRNNAHTPCCILVTLDTVALMDTRVHAVIAEDMSNPYDMSYVKQQYALLGDSRLLAYHNDEVARMNTFVTSLCA